MKFRARLRALEEGLLPPAGLPRPILVRQYVGSLRDSEGKLLGSNFDFNEAETGGKKFFRADGESLQDFKARVLAEVPTDGPAGTASFWCGNEGISLTAVLSR